MIKGLKRPIRVYLHYGIWVAYTIYFSMSKESYVQWFLWVMASIGTISLINMIIKVNYFEIINEKLVINKDFFRTKTVDLNKIAKINTASGFFSSPKIILKDETSIKYNIDHLKEGKLQEFMAQFNIPVE